jgi:hypothetical protein
MTYCRCCFVLIAVAVAAPARGATTVSGAAVGTTPRQIVYNAAAARSFIDAAKVRRVDINGIGDSNQLAGPGSNYGWDHGYAKAWTDRYGQYATSLFGMNADGAWNGGAGYYASAGYPYGAANTGAPAELHKYKLFNPVTTEGNPFPPAYSYFPAGYQEVENWTPSMWVLKQNPMWGENLTWHFTYGTFPDGKGGFKPTILTGLQKAREGVWVNSSTGSYGLADGSLSIPATTYQNTNSQLNFGVSAWGDPSLKGPFLGLWQRVTNERTKGVAYSTSWAYGGQALITAATHFKAQTDEGLREYVRNLVRHQNGAPMLLVNVNHGGNDGAFAQPSVGPHPAPSNTPAGFADNMEALITRYQTAWSSLGYDATNLVFQYGPYHPAPLNADDGTGRTKVQRLSDWEKAIMLLSDRHPEFNLLVVRGSALTTPMTMSANQWYTSAADNAHLSIDGYIAVSELAVRQLAAYARPEAITNASQVTSLSMKFTTDISAQLTPDALILRELTSNTLISPFDLAINWDAASKTATWTFQGLPLGALPVGDYEARLNRARFSPLGENAPDPNYFFKFSAAAAQVPEPASMGLVLVGLTMLSRRRR